jgi:hypothetical protein
MSEEFFGSPSLGFNSSAGHCRVSHRTGRLYPGLCLPLSGGELHGVVLSYCALDHYNQ